MIRLSMLVFTIPLALGGVFVDGISEAATLFTPVTVTPTRPSDIQCIATNVGTKDQIVQVQLISFDGTMVLADSTPAVVRAGGSLNSGTVGNVAIAYCKIVAEGAKSTIRGAILVHDQNTGDILVEVPAQ